jgi:hypothetical protein
VEGWGLKGVMEAAPDELTTTEGPMDAFQTLEIRPGPIPSARLSADFAAMRPPQKKARGLGGDRRSPSLRVFRVGFGVPGSSTDRALPADAFLGVEVRPAAEWLAWR